MNFTSNDNPDLILSTLEYTITMYAEHYKIQIDELAKYKLKAKVMT